ncbi:MAG TPA: NAD-dependent epimerase/dehydratase family protein [Candidatus Saccharimonadales bacterium]|nr:NAD-dependent epimerase/dehydratase family protein [Candidatus Saccharimonadales bacterium]
MRILVTGSAGFIGSNLCTKLLSQGHEVIGIDNHNDEYDVSIKEARTEELKKNPKFRFIKLDVVNDAFNSIFQNETVDYTIHLAAKDIYYDSAEMIKYTPYLVTNVVGTSKIFELSNYLKAKKFIFASTYSVYGNVKKPLLTEKKILPKPISPHGASKMAAEEVIHFMNNFYKLPAVILRIFSVYGPGMKPHTVIPLIIDRLNRNLPIDLYSNDTTRDYIYIDDAVNYIIASLNKRIKFQAINIASGKSTAISQLVTEIATIMGKDPSKVIMTKHEKDFNRLVPQTVDVSIDRAKKILHYEPKVTLTEGLKTTVEWYLAHQDILAKSTHGTN